MNLHKASNSRFHLIQEMMETVDIVRRFDPSRTEKIAGEIRAVGKLLITGEGSSRIFPAKNAVRKSLIWGMDLRLLTEGSRQAMQYDLSDFAVFFTSNSGRTKEVLSLAQKLAKTGNEHRFGLTANPSTPLENLCRETFVLGCGKEQAVAATKSVVEQALFYESILRHVAPQKGKAVYPDLADAIERALTLPIDPDIVSAAAEAPTLYFSGWNDGVAEELTLKTNEIARKKSDYLEGTYALHGIEEVMNPKDVVVVVDPIPEEIDKFREVLAAGVGIHLVAFADRETPFATIRIPDAGEMNPYVYLCLGWNLLVEIGLRLGIDMDKSARARKVGNEVRE